MDDPSRRIERPGDEFEHLARPAWADDEQAILAVVFVLDEAQCVRPSVGYVLVGDAVRPSASRDLHSVKSTLTL